MQQKIAFLAIDPGKSGAVAVIYYPEMRPTAFFTPTEEIRTTLEGLTAGGNKRISKLTFYKKKEMANLLFRIGKCRREGYTLIAGMEVVRGRETDSKETVRIIGLGAGLWEMAAAVNDIPELQEIHQWKPKYLPKDAPKSLSLMAARELYPQADLPLAKHEAQAEALLMADYLYRKYFNLGWPETRAKKAVVQQKERRQRKATKKRSAALPAPAAKPKVKVKRPQ